MKRSKLEKQLKKELEQATPCDFSAIREKCDLISPENESLLVTTCGEISLGNRKFGFLAVALAAVLALTLIFFTLTEILTKPLRFTPGSFILDVNPSVEVCYDEKGKVTSVQGLNDDGKALLVGVELKGKSYQEAAEVIFGRCVAMGYFCVGREDNAILATALDEAGEKDELMTSEVKSAFVNAFAENKIRGVVIVGVTNDALQTQAEKYGVDVQKYALILSYLALGGELSETQYSTVSVRELYAAIQEKQEALKAERLTELELVLSKFEAELFQTLTEQIEGLVETLGVCLPLDTDAGIYDEKLQVLSARVAALENAQSQRERKKIIDSILSGLEELKGLDEDVAVDSIIESAKISISVVYDFFEKAFLQFKKVSASPEEISAVRVRMFAEYAGLQENYDFSAWQSERERVVSETWYSLKKDWEDNREWDF